MFLSHIDVSFSLPLSLKSNQKTSLGENFKRKEGER